MDVWSKAFTFAACETLKTRSRRRAPTIAKGRTSCASSMCRIPKKAGASFAMSFSGSRRRCSYLSPQAGGVRREKDVRVLLEIGVDKVIVNSAVVASPALISRLADRYGSQSIVVGVDARRLPPMEVGGVADYEVLVHGRSRSTGLDVVWWCERVDELGAGEILLTGVDAEENKSGYDVEITRAVARRVSIPVIAGGGLSKLEHLLAGLAVGEGEADAVLGAAIFHFGLYTIEQAKEFLHERGVPVRLLPSRVA